MADAKHDGHSRQKRGESAPSWTRSDKGEIAGNSKKRCVDSPAGKSKHCIIHVPGHYAEECEVLREFGTKYAKSRPTKDHGNSPVSRKKH